MRPSDWPVRQRTLPRALTRLDSTSLCDSHRACLSVGCSICNLQSAISLTPLPPIAASDSDTYARYRTWAWVCVRTPPVIGRRWPMSSMSRSSRRVQRIYSLSMTAGLASYPTLRYPTDPFVEAEVFQLDVTITEKRSYVHAPPCSSMHCASYQIRASSLGITKHDTPSPRTLIQTASSQLITIVTFISLALSREALCSAKPCNIHSQCHRSHAVLPIF